MLRFVEAPGGAVASLIWLVAALALLALEWLGAEFDGLVAAAVAALAVSVLCAWLPLSIVWQLLLFGGSTLVLLAVLQRWSHHRGERAIRQSEASQYGEVLSGFGDPCASGRVLWHGQSWAAENLKPSDILRAGERVLVMGRDGTNLQVIAAPSQADEVP